MKRLFFTNEKTDNRIFQYFLWFQPSDAWMLLDDTTKEILVFLDVRYLEKEIQELQEWKIEKVSFTHDFLKQLGDYLLAYELVMLEKSIPYAVHEKLMSPDRDWNILFSFEPTSWQSKLRSTKNPEQIEMIRHAIDITEQVREHILELADAWTLIGKTELRLRGEMIRLALELGADGEAFDAIVATWAHTAIPHHNASDEIIGSWALLVDMGRRVAWWCSDFTRTLRLGDAPDPEFMVILDVVQQAHAKAISLLEPWIWLASVALAARKVIEDSGYGEFYPHSLGHWLGLDVHEAPRVSWRSEDILESWMVITIEPGIYLPGKFGVRWEDAVVIEE